MNSWHIKPSRTATILLGSFLVVQNTWAVFCSSCGKESGDEAKFCSTCGRTLAVQTTPVTVAPPVEPIAPVYKVTETSSYDTSDNHDHHVTPLQISIISPVQAFPASWDIFGFRLNAIYGKNENVGFLDVGLINHTTGEQNGIQCGFINRVRGGMYGIQAGLMMNMNGISRDMTSTPYNGGTESLVVGIQLAWTGNLGTCTVKGAQVSCFNLGASSVDGAQIGFCNISQDVTGIQIGGIGNRADGMLDGIQIGLINRVEGTVKGAQIGVINICGNELRGWQIGALNFYHNGKLPFMPLVNVGF